MSLSSNLGPVPAASGAVLPTGLHVLFACSDFRIGGHSAHTLNFARALRRQGCRAGVLVTEPFGDLYDDFVTGLDYITVVRRGLESRDRYLSRLSRQIRILAPDVLVNNAVPAVQAALPLLPVGVCRVSVVHNNTSYEVGLGLSNGPWLDCVVAVSDNIRVMLEEENKGRVPLATIPVGVHPPACLRQQEEAADPFRLIYVGRMEPQKNLPGLLRVLAKLHEDGLPFVMTMVGGGSELKAVMAESAAAPYRDQITFAGVQTQVQVARWLDQNDFLLMTSLHEGTPHAILEAMSHGLAPLVSRLPGATDRIITDGRDGFLLDRDQPGQYAETLRRFRRNPGSFGSISRAAIQTALGRYGADGYARQLASHFNRASRPETPAPKAAVPTALRPHFPGLALQCKHRAADLWRRWTAGLAPCQTALLRGMVPSRAHCQ
jgi:glycosyltransferase involved in cell wall biosynthesis